MLGNAARDSSQIQLKAWALTQVVEKNMEIGESMWGV